MVRLFLAAVVALITLGAGSSAGRGAPVLKCPPGTPILFPDAPEPAFVLNARMVQREVLERVHRDSIESIDIVCAIELHRTFGVEAQRSGFVVFTSPGPSTALQQAVDSIASLQKAYFAEHGRFATAPRDLGWSDPAGLVTIELTVSKGGSRWSARGTHRYLPGAARVRYHGGGAQPSIL